MFYEHLTTSKTPDISLSITFLAGFLLNLINFNTLILFCQFINLNIIT